MTQHEDKTANDQPLEPNLKEEGPMPATLSQYPEQKDPVPCWQAKACPFCGWVPSIQPWHGGAPTKMLIACDYDGCHVSPSVSGETRAEALRHWNRRVPRTDRIAKAQDNARIREARERVAR